jgi:putative ABC transport system permease protein
MKLTARVRTLLAFLFRRSRFERDMNDEMRVHLRHRVQDLERQGVPHAQAERRARIEFGAGERYREECREALGSRLLAELGADIRHGLRQLRRNPGFTTVALLTLALGIGANTAIFSMLNGMLLRALPYPQPRQLYVVHEAVPQWSGYGAAFNVNAGNFLQWQGRCPAFAGMAEVAEENFVLTGQGSPHRVRAALVPANFFPLLGARPQLGRDFLSSEQQRGHDQEVVLSDRLWRQDFHGDPAVVGRPVTLNGAAFTVVGILPPEFRFPAVWGGAAPELYKPVVLAGYDLNPGIGNFRYSVIARLKPGATAEQALAELNAVEAGIARHGDPVRHIAPGQFDLHALLVPLKTAIVGDAAARALEMLAVAAALVLLIVCANLANLLLAKNADRAREVAVRGALGATTRRLTRQFLTEGFLVAAAGGVLGLGVAAAALRLLVRNAPLGIPRVDGIHLDATVLLFTLGLSLFAAVLFTVLPVLLLLRIPPAATLKATSSRQATGGRGGLRSGLVVAEVALCALLLVGALLLVQSLVRVSQANQWMQQQNVLAVPILTPGAYHSQAEENRFYESVLDKVQAMPGVLAAAFTPVLPLHGGSWGDDVVFREAPRPARDTRLGDFYFISPGFGRAIGLPLLAGRWLSEQDRGRDVVLISENTARQLLPGRNPIGAHLLWAANDKPVPREVIGIVGDTRTAPEAAPSLAVYVPLWSFSEPGETLVVRTRMPRDAAAPALRQAVASVNPQAAIPDIETLQSLVKFSTGPRRYETTLGALFALCAVLLAAIGLYGVMSYSVSQRAHEIGVRMALGARSGDVLRPVVARGLGLALAGVALGLGAARLLSHFLAGLLYGVPPDDPATFLTVALLLTAIALLACYGPARRATRVDPVSALRCE